MKNTITINTIINKPIDLVWRCYTEPEQITQWNFASPEWHTPKAINNFEVGQKFIYTMAAKDGSMSFDFSGQYLNIKQNELIDVMLDDKRSLQTSFASENGQTKITQVFEAENENPVKMQKLGWQAILDNFKKHCEGV